MFIVALPKSMTKDLRITTKYLVVPPTGSEVTVNSKLNVSGDVDFDIPEQFDMPNDKIKVAAVSAGSDYQLIKPTRVELSINKN